MNVKFDTSHGTYEIRDEAFGWALSGSIAESIKTAAIRKGHDSVGSYAEIDFEWGHRSRKRGTIRRYAALPILWFRAHYDQGVSGNGVAFPDFHNVPSGLKTFSYRDGTFSPPTFGLAKTATPWLFFDEQAHSMVISPASGFMVSTMAGDGKSQIAVGLGSKVEKVPAGFNQDAVVVFGEGIGACWDRWGAALRGFYHKRTPQNDADPILKSFGYWTDNGADYYYNYDSVDGYAGTLLNLRHRYEQEGIPLGYLQLDSWWYQKSTYDPAGHQGGAKKNNRLPIGSWNRYGGLMEYRAHPDLFPNGLASFQQTLGLPLAVHNRWIDRTSPYHDRYRISGVAAVDPEWWRDTVAYLKQSGVACYEQDWLDQIYMNSPEMATSIGVGDAFTDGMAEACERQGLSMQYCMGTPRFFLQGLKYRNLTTIRTSGDRFEPGKWSDFLYVSRLANEVGVWPWCDVFKSGETANMILSVLSAGPVGTGDALGRENKENIMKAARPDGIIVKPDQPLLPTDQTTIDGANKSRDPFVATTFTDHNGLRTRYLFAFPRAKGERLVNVRLRGLGVSGNSYVLNLMDGNGQFCGPDDRIRETIGKQGFLYLMIAPSMGQGFAFLGDAAKFVPTGKQRIVSIAKDPRGLRIRVSFAPQENEISLQCASQSQFALTGPGVTSPQRSGPTRFSFTVKPRRGARFGEVVLVLPP